MTEIKDSQLAITYDLNTSKCEVLLPNIDGDKSVPYEYIMFAALADAIANDNHHIRAITDEFLKKVDETPL